MNLNNNSGNAIGGNPALAKLFELPKKMNDL